MTILVYGATSRQGKAIASALVDGGFPVRIGTRRPETVNPRLATSAEIMHADLEDAPSLDRAPPEPPGALDKGPGSSRKVCSAIRPRRRSRRDGWALKTSAASPGPRSSWAEISASAITVRVEEGAEAEPPLILRTRNP